MGRERCCSAVAVVHGFLTANAVAEEGGGGEHDTVLNGGSEPPCFETPDRLSAVAALKELKKLAPRRKWILIEVNCTLVGAMKSKNEIMQLMFPAATVVRTWLNSTLFVMLTAPYTIM